MAPSYALYSIVAYYLLNMVPHFYAVTLIRRNNNGKWSNAAPHSSNHQSKIQSSVTASCFARYERARRAHANGNETLPLVVAAVLASELAKLNPDTMNLVMSSFLCLRIAHFTTYILVESERLSHLRTVFYGTSTLELLFLICKATGVLAEG